MSLAASAIAPRYILYDDNCEFVWRQPLTVEEWEECIRATRIDECESFGCDGNLHWTPSLVSDWWRRRDNLIAWAKEILRRPLESARAFREGSDQAKDSKVLTSYLEYMTNGEAYRYLREYVFYLKEGREARPDEELPEI